MEKNFIQYVAETKTEYKYIVKFAVMEVSDNTLDSLEEGLQKYGLKSASAFRKSPIQESPLDFPKIKNIPVHTCNITLSYPASLDFLRVFICNCTGLPESCVVVYSENDPRQIETDLYIERSSPEYKENYKARLGTDYEDDSEKKAFAYGKEYNIEFLKQLEQVRKERELTVGDSPLSPDAVTDHSTLPNDYHGFNDDKQLPKEDLGLFGRVKRADFKKNGIL